MDGGQAALYHILLNITFKRVLINNQQTASFNLITKRDAISLCPARTSGGRTRHAGRHAGRYVLCHGACARVEGSGGICRGIQDLNPH